MDILSKDLIKEWNMTSLSPIEQRVEVLRIGEILYQALLVKSLDILSEKDESELDTLLDIDTTTTEDVILFLKSKIPTFDRLIKDLHKELKNELLIHSS
ncbi:MAG: hypothetical protein WAX85_01565 [Minisyncoccia bacterium]